MTYSMANPGHEDDLAMDIYVAELEWVDADNGGLLEIASEFLNLSIDEQGDLSDKFPWRLCIEAREENKALCGREFLPGGWAERDCVDLVHAYHLAEAAEREMGRRIAG
jgi:hypothetical protein